MATQTLADTDLVSNLTLAAPFAIVVVTCLATLATILLYRKYSRFPPGPPSRLLSGVASTHPKTEYWKTYADWGSRYGSASKGLVSFHIWGRRRIVINTGEVATDMIDKNSLVYSDRPRTTMVVDLCGRNSSFETVKYGKQLQRYRGLLHRTLNVKASEQWWNVQEAERDRLLQSLLTDPESFAKHIRKFATAVVMKVAFGYKVKNGDDEFVNMIEEMGPIVKQVNAPGWMVDSFPILKYYPSWAPGGAFKRKAKIWRKKFAERGQIPQGYVKEQMRAGTALPSFSSIHLEGASQQREEDVLYTASGLYAAAADTSASAVTTFIALIAQYPDIQRRAQEEVDRVVGLDRLPAMTDRPTMPYLEQLMQEVLRWAPPLPMGLPHCTSRDEEYCGYKIPEGTTIDTNIWAMMRDENVYKDPHIFNPERFAPENPEGDPRALVFGFGRRRCPGLYTALSAMFIQMSSILATFDVDCSLDADGQRIVPKDDYTTGLISYIKPFNCVFKVRSPKAAELVQAACL